MSVFPSIGAISLILHRYVSPHCVPSHDREQDRLTRHHKVSWDDRKSEALWTIISGVSQTEIDCKFSLFITAGLMLMTLMCRARAVSLPRRERSLLSMLLTLCCYRAVQFEVTVEFLLQMVSYLTERHTAQLRAQMRKAAAGGRGSAAPSPIPGGEPVGYADGMMRRAGSIGGRTSALSMRKEALAPKDGDVTNNPPGTPITAKTSANPLRPAISRNSSQTTLVPGQNPSLAAPVATTSSNRISSRSSDPQRRRLSLLSIKTGKDVSSGDATHEGTAAEDNRSYRPAAESPTSPVASTSPSSSSSDSDSADQMRSRYIRRPPRFQSGPQDRRASDDDEDDELAFLPATRNRQQQQQQQQQQNPRLQRHNNNNPTGSTSTSDGSGALDLHATVTKLPLNYRDHGHPSTPRNRIGSGSGSGSGSQQHGQQVSHGHSLSSTKHNHPQLSTIQSQTSDSSASSAAIIPSGNPRRLASGGDLRVGVGAGVGAGAGGTGKGATAGPSRHPPGPLSPRRMDMLSREGSEGAPSMGSSFSDLDGEFYFIFVVQRHPL